MRSRWRLVMESGLKVRLHLLIPAVENAVSGGSFRPGDVLKSRAGISVEIGNTDAEGRLILAMRFIVPASSTRSDHRFRHADRGGACGAGPDLPALFTRRDETAQALIDAGLARMIRSGACPCMMAIANG
jgi:leucyl aminopeptidase